MGPLRYTWRARVRNADAVEALGIMFCCCSAETTGTDAALGGEAGPVAGLGAALRSGLEVPDQRQALRCVDGVHVNLVSVIDDVMEKTAPCDDGGLRRSSVQSAMLVWSRRSGYSISTSITSSISSTTSPTTATTLYHNGSFDHHRAAAERHARKTSTKLKGHSGKLKKFRIRSKQPWPKTPCVATGRVEAFVHKGEAPLSDDERRRMQVGLKHITQKSMVKSTHLDDLNRWQAIAELGECVDIEGSVLQATLGDFVSKESLSKPHAKMAASVTMALERSNDTYRVLDGHKKAVTCLSNRSHGRDNVLTACKVLLVAYIVGFDSNQITNIKLGLSEMAKPVS